MTKECKCGSTEFKMTRKYFVECTVDADGRDISTGGLKGLPDEDSEIECAQCGKVLSSCKHVNLNVWVLEDMAVKYNNDPDVPKRDRFLDSHSSEGWWPYHATCKDCGMEFDQVDMARELGIEATTQIVIDGNGGFNMKVMREQEGMGTVITEKHGE